MAQNTFKAFLGSQRWNTVLYDQFVGHALGDPELPDPKSWEELRDYINRRNPDAPPETLEAAEYAWQRYLESTREPG
jgi:hypothetical protein